MHGDHPQMSLKARPLRAPGRLLFALALTGWGVSGCGGDQDASGQAAALAGASGGPVAFTKPELMGYPPGDDWEPAISADRRGGVHLLYKHYDVGAHASDRDLHLLYQRSADGGASFTRPAPIAPGPVGGGQFDSQIAVDPQDDRVVWAAFLQDDPSQVAVVRSSDGGLSFSPPRIISAQAPGLDKPILAVRGALVAVAYDDDFNTFTAVSEDGGSTWRSRILLPGDDRYNISIATGGAIDSRGDLYFAFSSFDVAHAGAGDGPGTLWLGRSSDRGAHWTRTLIAESGPPYPCDACGYAFLGVGADLKVGPDDTVYLLWNATPAAGGSGAARVYLSRSTDHGVTFSSRVDVSDAVLGVEHAFPALATGRRPGDVRIGWMDTRRGDWNVFFRKSLDGGRSFGPLAQISGQLRHRPYQTSTGFLSPYGDYFQMSVGDDDVTHVAWGEGPSWIGPGNIWFARGR